MFLEYFMPAFGIVCSLLLGTFLLFSYKLLFKILDIICKNKAIENKEALKELEEKISTFSKSKWYITKTTQPPNDKMIILHLTNNVANIELAIDKKKY